MGNKVEPGEKGFSILILLLSLFILIQAYFISGFSSITSPGVFPMVTGTVMVISSSIIVIKNVALKMVTRESLSQKIHYVFRTVFPKQIIVFSGIIILYMILLVPLHFLVSSFLFLIVSMVYFLGLKFAKSAIPLSAIVLFVIYVIFHYIFRIVLP